MNSHPSRSLRTRMLLFTAAIALVASGPDVAAQVEERVIAVVDTYHAALASGDSATALALLAEDVVILESGGVENKQQYRSGHLGGDMRFAQTVARERGDISVRILGDVAWAWSTSVTRGRMGDREIDAQGAELMVLGRTEDSWRIEAIHWSSRQRR